MPYCLFLAIFLQDDAVLFDPAAQGHTRPSSPLQMRRLFCLRSLSKTADNTSRTSKRCHVLLHLPISRSIFLSFLCCLYSGCLVDSAASSPGASVYSRPQREPAAFGLPPRPPRGSWRRLVPERAGGLGVIGFGCTLRESTTL